VSLSLNKKKVSTLWAKIAIRIVTRYRLNGLGSNPGGGDVFCTCADTHPTLVPKLKKE
jgi:hypothetical protein